MAEKVIEKINDHSISIDGRVHHYDLALKHRANLANEQKRRSAVLQIMIDAQDRLLDEMDKHALVMQFPNQDAELKAQSLNRKAQAPQSDAELKP